MNPLSRVIPRPIRYFLHVSLIALALVMLTATALAAQPHRAKNATALNKAVLN